MNVPLCLKAIIFILEIILDFDPKMLSFKTRKVKDIELKLKSTEHLGT